MIRTCFVTLKITLGSLAMVKSSQTEEFHIWLNQIFVDYEYSTI